MAAKRGTFYKGPKSVNSSNAARKNVSTAGSGIRPLRGPGAKQRRDRKGRFA